MQNYNDLLSLVNTYPSPHNGQPIRLKQVGKDRFELYFQKERGLQATDISYIFSFVTMGVFIEYLVFSAKALGYTCKLVPDLPSEDQLRGNGHIKFGSFQISQHQQKPDKQEELAIRFRQTSRKKYSAPIPESVTQKLLNIAANQKMILRQLNRDHAHEAIWLNQRAVFDDMFDEKVRLELNHWLRYNQEEKQNKPDGLAYDCMELNGSLMKFLVHHPSFLRLPGVSTLLKKYYLRTMSDESAVFYMLAPFGNEKDSFEVGKTIAKLWHEISKNKYYLHPFGTIMSNKRAHRDFLELTGVKHESRESSYLVFIFRAGKSEPPVPSLRIPSREHLLMEVT